MPGACVACRALLNQFFRSFDHAIFCYAEVRLIALKDRATLCQNGTNMIHIKLVMSVDERSTLRIIAMRVSV
jgi:hypothetical protein